LKGLVCRLGSSPAQVSAEWTAGSEVVELKNGRKILIGGLTRSHRERYLTALNSLSSRTLYLRFLSPITEISDAQVDRFLDVGHDGREALIAVSFDTDEIVGVARFATDPSRKDQVEIGLVVVDAWQFQGVGSSLLDRLIELASRCGYRVVGATSLAENAVVSSMLRARGFTALTTSLGITEWALYLSPTPPS
jgi:GNAT superfamily N-acetyltransferase